MSTKTFGLDLLGRRGWRAEMGAGMVALGEPVTKWLPTALLPIRRSEMFLQGMDIEAHRRGRGLSWPPEAQVPVLGSTTNGTGRLPMAAVLELLVLAEQEAGWGRLASDRVSWSPDGHEAVDIDLQRLIGQAIFHQIPMQRGTSGWTIGVVVPDGLQAAGQQLVVDACRAKDNTALLVPRTIAAALGWAQSAEAEKYRERASAGDGTPVGHLLIIDAGLGPWIAARVPIISALADGRRWLVPIRNHRLWRSLPGPTGWQIASTIAQSHGEDWLARLLQGPWLEDHLSGSLPVNKAAVRAVAREQTWSAVHSLRALEEGRTGTLDRLLDGLPSELSKISTSDIGPCLGFLVVGALAELRIEDSTVSAILARCSSSSVLHADAGDVAIGAAWAAAGVTSVPPWPTWREVMEPIDIYYIGKDADGDPSSRWMPLIESSTIAAGQDYRTDRPIRGLQLERGHSIVRIVLRRATDEIEGYDYRAVHTASVEDFALQRDIPIDVDVHARPGQGFAVVSVTSRMDDRFNTRLDWLTMQPEGAPEPPKLGYIPKSLCIKADAHLYEMAKNVLQETLDTINKAITDNVYRPESVETLAMTARKIIAGIKAANFWEAKRNMTKTEDTYLYYAVFARDGTLHPTCNINLVADLRKAMASWHRRGSALGHDGSQVRRLGAYMYWGCPPSIREGSVLRAEQSLADSHDLQVLGLTTNRPKDFHTVYRLVVRVLQSSRSANNYLRALRDIARLNDGALSDAALTPETCEELTVAVVEYLTWAKENKKPLVVANCVEALLYMLKRRRYDSTYLSADNGQRRRLDESVAALLAANTADVRRPWLNKRCIELLGKLSLFLSYAATEKDGGDIVGSAGDDENDE